MLVQEICPPAKQTRGPSSRFLTWAPKPMAVGGVELGRPPRPGPEHPARPLRTALLHWEQTGGPVASVGAGRAAPWVPCCVALFRSPDRSVFAGYRFPADVIILAVRC